MIEPVIYLQESSPYSVYVLAIRSTETKMKYLQDLDIFLREGRGRFVFVDFKVEG